MLILVIILLVSLAGRPLLGDPCFFHDYDDYGPRRPQQPPIFFPPTLPIPTTRPPIIIINPFPGIPGIPGINLPGINLPLGRPAQQQQQFGGQRPFGGRPQQQKQQQQPQIYGATAEEIQQILGGSGGGVAPPQPMYGETVAPPPGLDYEFDEALDQPIVEDLIRAMSAANASENSEKNEELHRATSDTTTTDTGVIEKSEDSNAQNEQQPVDKMLYV